MPRRILPLVANEVYHVTNQGIDHRPTFINKYDYQRALEAIKFYQFQSPPIKLSRLLTLSNQEREKISSNLQKTGKLLIEFISYCLMPNHYHFLLKQLVDGGIAKFIGNFQNSFTRYFNTKNERIGPLFLDQFKAVRIETDEQLLHVSRYIHLNPYSSFIVKKISELENYQWSSLAEFLGKTQDDICHKELILSSFKNINSYKKFVFDQADYQRELDKIKHLKLE